LCARFGNDGEGLHGDLIGLSSVTLGRTELGNRNVLLCRADFASTLVSVALKPADEAFLDQNAALGSDNQQEQNALAPPKPDDRVGHESV